MKKHNILLIIIAWSTNLFSQIFPANGIGYQAMLTKSEKVTYGTKLENIPIANKEISARFELVQSGNSIFEDLHVLKTDKNGIFSCIIGTGQTKPIGATLSSIDWQKDSVIIRVFIDAGEGENLFSEQKLWSTGYAMFANTAGKAMNDKDTNSTNELQYLNLVGDSLKLTAVSGGISLKPWSDAISDNTQSISSEKSRAEAAELALQNQISGINVLLGNKTTELSAAQDTLVKFRSEINGINNAVSQNLINISNNKTDISKNTSAIKDHTDSIAIHRSELNKNRGDINKNNASISQNKTDLAKHISDDKDTDNTNELSDLSFNTTTFELNLSNPLTTGNKVNLNSLRDNLGNHKATDTLDLNGQVLTDRSGDSLMIAVSGNDIDLTLESEDEIFIRTINNPNNATHGDIQLESSDDVIIDAKTNIEIIGGDDVTIEALGDDLQLESSDDIKIYSGEDVFIQGQNVIEISSGGGDNITINSDNDIELKTTANDYVEIWTDGSFMYTLPNKRGTVGQFLQRSSNGTSEYFTDWSAYKMPTTDGTNGQALVTDGNGNVTWGTAGDNLGNHKATQNIELNGKYLSNDGGNEGISISNTGQIGIGTNAPDANAILDISSTTQGVLMPRMTESQRNQITKPANGSIIFNTTNNKLEIFTDSVNGDFIQQGSTALYDLSLIHI